MPSASISQSQHAPVNDSYSTQEQSPGSRSNLDLNLRHLQLFYHYEHSTCATVAGNPHHVEEFRRAIITRGCCRRYLMYAILACSALHMSLRYEDRPMHDEAATLQAQALDEFHVIQVINESNVLDVLLFQHVTALHVFCDVFTTQHTDFNHFLHGFVGCIKLLRGINSVVHPWWHYLAKTELGALMQASHVHTQETNHRSHKECAELYCMIDGADLSQKSIDVCQTAIEVLQSTFDAENSLGEALIRSTNMLFAWPITVSEEFTTLLEERRPEALVILAHYGIVLHKRRKSWAVGDSGRTLLRYIVDYLGESWKHLMAWPLQVIKLDEPAVTIDLT